MAIPTWIPEHFVRALRLLPDQFPARLNETAKTNWIRLIRAVSSGNADDGITAIDQDAREFTLTGDRTAFYPAESLTEVGGSSAVARAFDRVNDGRYTVVLATYEVAADRTVVEVSEAIPDESPSDLGCLRGNNSAATATGIQEIEEVLFDLRNAFNLSQAEGAMLAILGEIEGLSPTSTDDDEYRNDIRIQAAINNSNGRHFQIIDAVAALTGVTLVVARDVYPAHIRLQIVGSLPASGTRDRIFSMKGGGISMVIVCSDTTNPFTYTGDAGHVASFGGGFGGHFTIIGVVPGVPGAGSFSLAGNLAAVLDVGDPLQVKFSTGNDGWYTIASVAVPGATVITVEETVPNAVVDGIIYYGSQAETGHLAGIFGL